MDAETQEQIQVRKKSPLDDVLMTFDEHGKKNAVPAETENADVTDFDLADEDDMNIFNQYKPEEIIGQEIFDEFMYFRYRKTKTINGFYLSEENKNEVGLISQCHGLMTVTLLNDFGISTNDNIQDIIKTIQYILKETSNSMFCPTPYLIQVEPSEGSAEDDTSEFQINKYVDSTASVLSALINARELLYDTNTYDNLKNKMKFDVDGLILQIEDRIIDCVRELNASALKYDPANGKPVYTIEGEEIKNIITGNTEITYKGWNFAPATCDEDFKNYDTSLYFTYKVTSAYMDLKDRLDKVIEIYRDTHRKDGNRRFSEEIIAKYEKEEKYIRDKKFFDRFVDDFNGLYERCVDTGHTIDLQISNKNLDISENFVGTNFVSTSFNDMLSSTTNDALFNTLLCIGILINTGVDLDYLDYSRNKFGDASKQSDYIEKLQFGLQNVQKCYKKFTLLNKEFVVDQFVLNFNENIPVSLLDQAKVLRKLRIAPLSLTPLIIKVYNLISKYIIRYPQKQSITYLEMILRNRTVYSADTGKKKHKWSWDTDGYNVIINYMYVEVLKEFYDYYNKYELRYSDNQERIREQYNSDLSMAKNELEDKYVSKISSLTEDNQKLSDQIAELTRQCEQLKKTREPLLDEMVRLIKSTVSEVFADELEKQLVRIHNDNIRGNGSDINELTKAYNDASVSRYAKVLNKICTSSKSEMDDSIVHAEETLEKEILNKVALMVADYIDPVKEE